ncbi:DUF881 domain-containing protein [Tessaracoccus sp. OS52]|uniref:DUF881 domain-containing protein n=1 Tax=Tessaracoccus sp. OS52 TaxID=2886691 RepID=UPI001D104BAE|nr:DUF881 domain-containing protein [Tessaracoccus sp. OS52]MCC2594591.1 DUF881 domain-containing protein [Tessaracoccus sp. OS52]
MSDDPAAAPRKEREGFGRLTTVGIFILAGFMITVSAIAARGTDLRSERTASLQELVSAQTERNEDLRAEAEGLRGDVEELSQAQGGNPELAARVDAAGMVASTVPVSGPGLRVVLTDAPLDIRPAGVDDDSLIVHQQDIQAVVNALWTAGAEAMTIQGQRVISTTGIKCVGNSVVLHGVPYAPPYVIEAIGPTDAMEVSLAESRPVQIYLQYVEAYGLGYSESRFENAEFPAFVGTLNVSRARIG